MGQDNTQSELNKEGKQGANVDPTGGEGSHAARGGRGLDSSGFENEGHKPRDPELIGKQDAWRPTGDPVGERWDGESEQPIP